MAFMPHWPKNLTKSRQGEGLVVIKKVLSALGNPHLNLPPTLHVTGTNGKGSVTAYLYTALSSAGFVVHVYTSPHLLNVNERIVLAGKQISNRMLYNCLEEVRLASDGMGLCFFDAMTIAAFVAFSKVKADFLVMEVGMGGIYDATNVINSTVVSIITNISLDHTEFLGNTEEEIAVEKSGILRPGVPCVVGRQSVGTRMAIEYMAQDIGALLFRNGFEWDFSYDHQHMVFLTPGWHMELPRPALKGNHQVHNASIAIAAMNLLNQLGVARPELCYEDIVNSLQQVYWPARIMPIESRCILKLLSPDPSWSLFVDGAHNCGGAQAVAEWLLSENVRKPCYAIVGLTKYKDGAGFFSQLKPALEFACGVCVRSEPKAYTAKEIVAFAESAGVRAFGAESIEDALCTIAQNASAPGTIVICGSLYLFRDLHMLCQH